MPKQHNFIGLIINGAYKKMILMDKNVEIPFLTLFSLTHCPVLSISILLSLSSTPFSRFSLSHCISHYLSFLSLSPSPPPDSCRLSSNISQANVPVYLLLTLSFSVFTYLPGYPFLSFCLPIYLSSLQLCS